MQNEQILYIVLGSIAFLVILYLIVRTAVYSATKKANEPLLRYLNLANKLKIRHLLKHGVSQEEINSDVQKVRES